MTALPEYDLRRLHLAPGDILVAVVRGPVTNDEAARIRDAIAAVTDHPLLVLPEDRVRLDVLEPGDGAPSAGAP